MAIHFTAAKCPECGANLSIEEGRTKVFCSYCGAKIIITNDNELFVHHIDETKIRQTEIERKAMLAQMKIEERKKAAENRILVLKLIVTILIAAGVLAVTVLCAVKNEDSTDAVLMIVPCYLIGLIVLVVLWVGDSESGEQERRVRVPDGINGYDSKDYGTVSALFRRAGFKNVECEPLNDLFLGLFSKPGRVESITIDGEEITEGGREFDADAKVVIYYHSF